MTKKAWFLIGVSGSGKSTAANELVKDAGAIELNRDNVRRSILTEKGFDVRTENMWKFWNFKWENEVTKRLDVVYASAVLSDTNMVFSDTNLDPAKLAPRKKHLVDLGYEVHDVVIDTPLDVCIKRDVQRKDTVGVDVIWKQYEKFRKVYPKYVLQDVSDKPRAVLFDIDGTCTLGPHNRSPFEWNKVGQDLPNHTVLQAMNGLRYAGNKIVFLSGRDSVCREETVDWLYNTVEECSREYIDTHLFMRPEGDQRKDYIIKLELFFNHIDGVYDVQAVFDDRPQVIRNVWLELGIPTICVGNPYLEF